MQAQYRQAIDRYRQRIYSFARYSLRAPEDAEDVTQEVFIKLWQHWQKVDHERLGAWLMRVARNAVIDHVRRTQTAQGQWDNYAEVESQAEAAELEREIDRESFNQRLQQLIKTLDEPFRSIVLLRDVQGMSYAEIEQVLEMSQSQVKVYLHRGRRKLREDAELRRLFSALAESDSSGPAPPRLLARREKPN